MSQSDTTIPSLLRAALIHHAQGRDGEAQTLYRRILEFVPDHPQALGMLALTLADGPDEAEAEALLLRHIALCPDRGASLHALGRMRARQGLHEEALQLLLSAADQLPGLAPAQNDLGACLQRIGRPAEALDAFDRALAIDPSYAVAHANRGAVLQASRRFEPALDAFRAALAFAAPDQADLRTAILAQLAQAARKVGRLNEAEALLRAECGLRPDQAELSAELALLLEQAGKHADARWVRNDLARRAGLHRRGRSEHSAPKVLLLGAVGGGHTPTRYLVDEEVFAVESLTLLSPDQPDAPLGEIELAALRDADLVFNTLGEVDHDGGQFAAVGALLDILNKPVINPPDVIARTGRDRAPRLLGGIDGLIVPPVRRVDPKGFRDMPFEGPQLVRPAGDHGGENLVLLSNEADKAAYLAGPPGERLLVSPFCDYRSPDGHWRKYRLIFVDRRVFAFHLAVGDQWLVHYWRADMEGSDWKRAEEERFLADWRCVFGARAAAAVDAAAERLDLDYGGMDCALTQAGEVLLFEANACVLLHLDEPQARFDYKHRYVPQIRDAFTRMALRRMQL